MLRLTDLIATLHDPDWPASIARFREYERKQAMDYRRRYRPTTTEPAPRETIIKERIIERPTFRQLPPPPPRPQPPAPPTTQSAIAIDLDDDETTDI